MFAQKTVIVTGAAQGIGRGIAQAYAEQGANVIIADILTEQGTALAKKLQAQGYSAHFIETDVKSEQSVIAMFNKACEKFQTVHICINNAGKNKWTSPLELSLAEFDDIIATNLRSVFLCSREAAKRMPEGGAIVNMASTRAFMSEPHSESYAASKGGIVALTHAFASSLSEMNITVNCISPGWIETGDYEALSEIDHKQHWSQRVGKPDDIARACLYLTNPLNNFITGTNITIDGGMSKKMIYED